MKFTQPKILWLSGLVWWMLASVALAAPTPQVNAAQEAKAVTEQAVAKAQVNINTASREELRTLNGVGAVVADRIVSYREENGEFANVEQIQEVRGIGSRIYSRIEPYITVQ